MNRIKELRQQLGAAVDKAKVLVEKARSENRAMTTEEDTQYQAHMGEVSGFKRTIANEESYIAVETEIAQQRGVTQERTGLDPDQQRERFREFCLATRSAIGIMRKPDDAYVRAKSGNMEHFDAFGKFLRFGPQQLTAEERALMGGNALEVVRRDFGAGMTLRGGPNIGDVQRDFEARAAQSDVTGNLGAYTVPQGFLAELQIAMKYYAGMLDVGPRVLNTATGNDLPMPTTDDTANVGRRLSENSPVTNTAIPFGQKIMKAWKYSSDSILMPVELLQDTGIDLEAELVMLLAVRIGRKYNQDFTSNADGSGPSGILTDVTSTVTTTTGKLGAPQYDDLVGLKYSVNRAYRQGAKWMMSDNTLAGVLKLKDQNDRPLILDYLTTLQEDEPEKLLGQPIVINNDMPDPGTNGSPVVGNQCVLYGAWRSYFVRMVKDFTLLRLVERYADNLQIGYIGFSRADGRYIDAGQHPIKALVSATT